MQNPYDQIAEQWHSSERPFRHRKYVDMLLQGLPPGDKILDLGCGTGRPIAEYLIRQDFRVLGIDRSAKMLEIAKRIIPEAEFIQGDMLDLELDEQFAAVIAWDSIFHVDRTRHREIFRKLRKLLTADGRLLLSAGGSGEAGCTSEMYGHSFFYSGYEPEETSDLLRSEGFEIVLCEVDDPSSRGHIAIIAAPGK
jgi:cyclopropane fatty-acyl-phospholipid synthase-like methyltransferase